MFNKKNIAVAMAAATTMTAMAPVANVVFADVVENTQTEEIKALKEKVYELVNTRYTTNHNLLADETVDGEETVEKSAIDLAGSKVYDRVDVKIGEVTLNPLEGNYASFEKAFDKAYAEMKNGDVIKVEYTSTYGVRELEDGQIVNTTNDKYTTEVEVSDISIEGTNATSILAYLKSDLVQGTNADETKYVKVPVSNGYITVKKGDDKLDLNKPKFKVVDGYYVDAKGHSIKKFEAAKECLESTVEELIALGGVVEGYYPVVSANAKKVEDIIAVVKNLEAAQKESLTVGDLFEAEADRLTVKGNEIRNTIRNIMDSSNVNDNLRVKLTAVNKAGELVEISGEKEIVIDATTCRTVESDDALYKFIQNMLESKYTEFVKITFETTEDETKGTEWIPAYEATISEGRNEKFVEILRAFTGDTEILMHAGLDRYKTAVESSIAGWGSGLETKYDYKHVVLVSGANDKLVDGLTATPLAAMYDAPVLLTKSNEIPQEVIAEIQRLGATKVTIVGGTSGVSEAVETKLEKTYGLEVERLSGEGRYETSIAVANKMAELKRAQNGTADNTITEDDKFNEVFVVGGNGEADALSVSAVAGMKQVPILLTPARELNSEVKTFIQKYVNDKDNDADVYVVGGENSVNASVQNKLIDLSIFSNNNKIEVKRLAGEGRQETNAEVIAEFATMKSNRNDGSWSFVIANSSNASMVDALSAGALAVKTNSHIVLANENLTDSQEDALKSVDSRVWKSRQVGYKVSTAVAKFVGNIVKRS